LVLEQRIGGYGNVWRTDNYGLPRGRQSALDSIAPPLPVCKTLYNIAGQRKVILPSKLNRPFACSRPVTQVSAYLSQASVFR